MEDTHICQAVDMPNAASGDYGMLFGVFDGHGGSEVSAYSKENFKKVFIKQAKFKAGDFKQALIDTMLEMDKALKTKPFAMDAGTTACVVFVTKDQIYCANSGDSRAVLAQTNNKAIPLSEDHKPTLPKEELRIK